MSISTLPPLLSMSRAQLVELYQHPPAGPIPDGRGRGVALVWPGSPFARFMARVVGHFYWQGKVFDAEKRELRNSVSIFRVLSVRAKVYHGPSRLDGKESVVLDYSRTSWLARWVRDEIREVAPDVYLGLAYVGNIRVIWFALMFGEREAETT